MNKILHTALCAVAFCLMSTALMVTPGYPQGKGSHMGGLKSIVPEGPFDVGRNPALLLLQPEGKNSLGAFLRYEAYHRENPSMDIDSSSINNASGSIGDINIINLAFHLAFSTRTGNRVIGFAVSDPGTDQFSLRKDGFVTEGTMTGFPFYEENKSRTVTIDPAVVFALAYGISSNSSFGFQLMLGYRYSSEKNNTFRTYGSPVITEQEDGKRKTDVLYGELGFGYLFRTGDAQVGLLIKSGRLTFKKQEFSHTFAPGTSESESIPFRGDYTRGISIAAGGYKTLNSLFSFAIEGEYSFPCSFNDKTLSPDPMALQIKEQTHPIDVKSSLFLRGGIAYKITGEIECGMGLGYAQAEINDRFGTSGGPSTNTFRTDTFLVTAGIDYNPGGNIKFSIITYLTLLGAMQDRKNPSGTDRVSIDNTLLTLNAGLGLTYTY